MQDLAKSNVGDTKSYVRDTKSCVGDTKSYIGDTKSYVGDTSEVSPTQEIVKSYVGDKILFSTLRFGTSTLPQSGQCPIVELQYWGATLPQHSHKDT